MKIKCPYCDTITEGEFTNEKFECGHVFSVNEKGVEDKCLYTIFESRSDLWKVK